MSNSYSARKELDVNGTSYTYYDLKALPQEKVNRLPQSLKVLLENLLRFEDGVNVTKDDIDALLDWDPKSDPSREISFTPARVVMQDFTGVPAVVDLAAMRDAMKNLGGDPTQINPLSPADLVIDHSVMVDNFGSANAVDLNAEIEFQRNGERYSFLRWGQSAFENFRVVPPHTGIVHQVNLEYLAPVVFENKQSDSLVAYPDTVVGTDSHTTMINGLGVLGWGVGGIEAEAAMLGQPITMLIPQVVGFKLHGQLREGATATDLVLRVVEMLRELGVVGKFVEFFGDGLDAMSLADKATIANMAPEYGATCGFFALDSEAINYLRLTGRDEENIALVETYAKAQGMFRQTGDAPADYTTVLELDLAEIVPSVAGPKRPQDRINLDDLSTSVSGFIDNLGEGAAQASSIDGEDFELENGDVVIAAITSCTNTSNPGVIMASGLLAKKAADLGLKRKPWVKTSLAPGSQVVTEYLEKAGLMDSLSALGFDVVGYGCTTCIGNSGPLPKEVGAAIKEGGLTVASVLSGNRNFEGRVHGDVKMNFLASPPLVVAYALAGTTKIDWNKDAIGQDKNGNDVFLKDIWPSQQEVNEAVNQNITREMFQEKYADVFKGDKRWQSIKTTDAMIYEWDDSSTYVQNPPYFVGMGMEAEGIKQIENGRALALLGDSITTDHISPAGVIAEGTPAADYLESKGVGKVDFNSYGSRRGNHEVMMRGTFANIRLRNQMAPGTEGGWTTHQPSGEQMFIFDASMKYQQENTPLFILAGKEYGTGSSRDWAAKGSALLGVRVVVAQSFERIHRSNLIGMGVLPLQFKDGDGHAELGIDGSEVFSVVGLEKGAKEVRIKAEKSDGSNVEFAATVRIDTPKEWEYYENGGILKYVLRELASR